MNKTKEIDLSFTELEKLESKISKEIENEIIELDFLNKERNKIGNVENLGEVIQNIVWEQIENQIASTYK